ncbi:Bromodomain and WD repeat-containing protein 1 [Papilio machaon]|uniref:Bromodomain and WD repeat-containing protein 1 n=1 Tax=Papilio machaon TaxID=76193 RepID=A0A0N1PK94_PAPMA|nr:Bromodomain and WD repeat-containing protein 1 [Papilio machaon]
MYICDKFHQDLYNRSRDNFIHTSIQTIVIVHDYRVTYCVCVADYQRVVRTPMDLGTVRARLISGSYTRAEHFARDVRLVFSNSRLYNTNKRSRVCTYHNTTQQYYDTF